jgi:hypothetical protein
MIGYFFAALVIFVLIGALSFAPDIAPWVTWTTRIIAILTGCGTVAIGVMMVVKRRLQ